jgi:lysophospholipase L1-like esterase
MPLVLVGTTPRQEPGATCSQSDNPCAAYIADIEANVDLLAGDGLAVDLFDSRKYTTGTGIDMEDSIHPNPLGQYDIALSLAEVLQ